MEGNQLLSLVVDTMTPGATTLVGLPSPCDAVMHFLSPKPFLTRWDFGCVRENS